MLWHFNVEEITKVELISKPAQTRIFNLFPAIIWILKLIFTLKWVQITSKSYWISLNFNVIILIASIFLAESEFQNSNVGGKQIEKSVSMPVLK